MAGFAEKMRMERERRDRAMERALDRGARKADSGPMRASKPVRGERRVRHQMEKGPVNKPHSITGGQDARSKRLREIEEEMRELQER